MPPRILRHSPLATRLLGPLRGIEIGAAAHNPFGLPRCLNVDWSADAADNQGIQDQIQWGVSPARVDVVAEGDQLPFRDASLEYVLSSHVLEHMWDPIAALKEWIRVLKPGGVVFTIIPHRDRAGLDAHRPRTKLEELVDRHQGRIPAPPPERRRNEHHSVWVSTDVCVLFDHLDVRLVVALDRDDKVGNGFCVVGQVKCGVSTMKA